MTPHRALLLSILLLGPVVLPCGGSAAGVPLAGDHQVDEDPGIQALLEEWQALANQSIDELRKRDLHIRVTDRSGDPVSGATVRFQQTARAFPIGTAIAYTPLLTQPAYRDYLVRHFNFATHENEAKWYHNEAQRGQVTYERADAMLDFAELNGIPMRGHTIFWAPQRWQPAWVPELDDAELLSAVEERLEDAVTHFRGRFLHWDVNNEMLHGSFFEDRLGPGIRQWMFERARELDPDVKLFVNEYNIISGTEVDAYVQQIQGFLDRGFPLDGIGVQGHFRQVDPLAVQARLDKLAPFGLPIWITELDVELADDEARADALEAVMRTAFAHPAVEGIVLWGFWEGAHWRGPDAALVNLDWSLNAAGERFEELLAEWTSDETRSSDSTGGATARLFHGSYRVGVDLPGLAETLVTTELEAGAGPLMLDLQLGVELDPDFAINAGHAGAWFNPATPGQGLFIDVDSSRGYMFLGWFTFTGAGSEAPNQQRWFTAQGDYSGNTATLVLSETRGGRFDDPQAVTTTPVGEITLAFVDCNLGELLYRLDDSGLEGSFPLERVIPGSAGTCDELAGSAPQAVAINAGMDGAWYDEATSGQGFFIDAQPDPQGGNFLFLSWFTYGDDSVSGQRWLTAQGAFSAARAQLVLSETRGGAFDDPLMPATLPVGTVDLDFDDCSHALLRYDLPAEDVQGEIAVTRVLPGGQELCEALRVTR